MARDPTECIKAHCRDRFDLISPSGDQSTAKCFIEKVFSADRQAEDLVRLNRERLFIYRVGLAETRLGFLSHRLRIATRVDPVRQTELDLVRVSDRIQFVDADDLLKVIDTLDKSIR